MIKLKNILETSQPYSKNISELSVGMASLHANTTFKNSFDLYKQDSRVLYRGISDKYRGNYYYVNPRTAARISKDSNNLYVALMDALPSWNGYPKRSRSIIVGTSESVAEDYGDIFLVFLKYNANVAVCSEDDLWKGMPYLMRKTNVNGLDTYMMGLNELLMSVSRYDDKIPDIETKTYSENNIEEFFQGMIYLTKEVLEKSISDRLVWSAAARISKNMLLSSSDAKNGWRNYFNDLFDPVNNGISLSSVSELPYDEKHECWSDSDALLVKDEDQAVRILYKYKPPDPNQQTLDFGNV